jgi:hypothetical protein
LSGRNTHDILFLYGVRDDGEVVVCFPAHGQADGHIDASYVGNNTVDVQNGDHSPWPRYQYKWTGSDWVQSTRTYGASVAKDTNTAQLIALRGRNEGLRIIRPESPSPPQ